MNRKELKIKLDELGAENEHYELNGMLKPNRYILTHSIFKWQTYFYDEHGYISEKKEFKTEDQACQDMLSRLVYAMEWRKKYNVK